MTSTINSTEDLERNINKNNIRLLQYLRDTYTAEQQNQILKSQEKNIFLFLDETFSKEELRDIRTLLLETNDIDKFIKKYSTRIVDGKELLYTYNIEYIPHTNFISIEIKEIGSHKWSPSDSFLLEMEISERKKSALFKKLASKIYLEEYPIKNPTSAKQIMHENYEYFSKMIALYQGDLKYAIQSLIVKSRDFNGIHYMHKLEALNAQLSIVSYLRVSLNKEMQLNENELILLNKLLERYKYKLSLNKKIKSKYEL